MKLKLPNYRTVIIALIATAFSACSGSDTSGPAENNGSLFLRFDANGTRVTYNVQATLVAAFGVAGNQRNVLITGYDGTSNAGLQIYSGSTIGTGTYSGYTVDINAGTLVGVLIHYQDASGTVYSSSGVNTTDNLITITDMSASTMRGTFKARLKASGKPDIVVTNGEFQVARAN